MASNNVNTIPVFFNRVKDKTYLSEMTTRFTDKNITKMQQAEIAREVLNYLENETNKSTIILNKRETWCKVFNSIHASLDCFEND